MIGAAIIALAVCGLFAWMLWIDHMDNVERHRHYEEMERIRLAGDREPEEKP